MEKKQLPEEFADFIRLLNKNKVKYLLVGGWAVGAYGHPRATKDIDFLVSKDSLNLKRLKKVFDEFKSPPVNVNILKEDNSLIGIGNSPVRIEVINTASGINIDECYNRKNIIEIEDIRIQLISKDDLIKNKKAAGRYKDLADAEVLESKTLNPNINTQKKLKSKLIYANLAGMYEKELNDEKTDMKKRKKDNQYNTDLKILNITIALYKKAKKTENEDDILALHYSFNKNPENNKCYEKFKYKLLRKKIYLEIEYRFKELLKDEYSYLSKKQRNNSLK